MCINTSFIKYNLNKLTEYYIYTFNPIQYIMYSEHEYKLNDLNIRNISLLFKYKDPFQFINHFMNMYIYVQCIMCTYMDL